MFGSPTTPVRASRPGWIALGLVIGVTLSSSVYAQAQAPASQAQAAPTTRVFGSDAGMILNFIKADKTMDFEAIVVKLKEALQKSQRPERKQQAASWKVFRAMEAGPNGSVLYVFVMDPSVKGADYTVSTILSEAFPQEVQELFKKYADTYALGQNPINLTLVSDLGK